MALSSRPSRAPAANPASAALLPLPSDAVVLDRRGELARWQRRNAAATAPHVVRELRAAGNLDNLAAVANGTRAAFRGRYPFLDTDVYKALEGIAYVLAASSPNPELRDFYEESVDLIQRAQRLDGYLNSAFQNPGYGREPWSDLTWGHELYNLGHLVQAALAAQRQLGDDRLLAVARRFADLAWQRFGPEGLEAVCGHPEVEMALVELARETGEARYRELARLLIARRGHRTIEVSVFEHDYFQDEHPLSELPSVHGHAVRMGYLAAGATDVALDTSDAELLGALRRLWDDMRAAKLHISGGLGSRHTDESIGDRYELSPERAYSETCAAIAVMQWSWRMLLATGEASYAELYEQVLYNAYAAGLSEDGTAFFYDNALQRRRDHRAPTAGRPLREPWFVCPCCPPNVLRWTAQLHEHLVARAGDALHLLGYTPASISAGGIELRVETDYPWDGRVRVVVTSAAADAELRRLVLRVPDWAEHVTLSVGGRTEAVPGTGWVEVPGVVRTGDVIELELGMPVRGHAGHPHLDAVRGDIAIRRGPVLYCLESADIAAPGAPADVDDIVVTEVEEALARAESLAVEPGGGLETAHVAIRLPVRVEPAPGGALYPSLPLPETPRGRPAVATLRPYHLWGNRRADSMRVWLRSS